MIEIEYLNGYVEYIEFEELMNIDRSKIKYIYGLDLSLLDKYHNKIDINQIKDKIKL